ncbi:hypothetical protein LXL04_034266 [Taraxacum kok-saghyz]
MEESSKLPVVVTPRQGPRRAAAARCSSVEFLVAEKREDEAGSEHGEEETSSSGEREGAVTAVSLGQQRSTRKGGGGMEVVAWMSLRVKKKMAAEEAALSVAVLTSDGNNPNSGELDRGSHEEEERHDSLLAGEGHCEPIGRGCESSHGAGRFSKAARGFFLGFGGYAKKEQKRGIRIWEQNDEGIEVRIDGLTSIDNMRFLGFEKMPASWTEEEKEIKDLKALSQIRLHLSNDALDSK